MQDEKRVVEYEGLNWLGKTLYWTGAAARLTAEAIDFTLKKTAGVVAEAERAFRQGLDPNVDEAKILEEYDERKERRPPGTSRPS